MRRELLFVTLSLVVLCGCSSTPEAVGNQAQGESQPTTQASIQAKQIAAEQEALYVVEFRFAKADVDLNGDAKKKLDRVLSEFKNSKQPREVKVVSWADAEYPAKADRKLSKAAQELADRRAEAVAAYLAPQLPKVDVERHNMAVRSGAFADLLRTGDARIKNSLERAGIATTETVRGESESSSAPKAGRCIVMFVL